MEGKPGGKKIVFRILMHACAAVSAVSTAAAAQPDFTVVVDPGHGGDDYGAVYGRGRNQLAEKEITLTIGKIVARELRTRRINAVLTRETDKHLELPERTELANKIRADVFISLHMNSAESGMARRAQGVETYILNNTTNESSQRLAALENKSHSALRGSAADSFADPNLALIVKDLMLDGNREASTHLACSIQSNLVAATSSARSAADRNRGVKQALFYVLLGADMPSALVEMGFISNARDRALVLSRAGKIGMGRAIARAIDEFRQLKGSDSGRSRLSRCQLH